MKARIVLLAAAGLPLLAAYTYFYTDTLTSINGANWYSNGTVTTSASGLNASSATGGSVISKVAIPDATANYEVKAKLRLTQDGGNYTLYLRASNDAWLATPATGSFYAVELQSPVIFNGVCSATLAVYKQVSGNTTQLTQTQTTCHDNLELHAVIGGSQLIVYADNVELVWLFDGSLTTGKGGVGGRGMPAGNGIAQVDLGRLDSTGPNTILSSSISSSIFPDRADFAWQGVTDDANGVGLFGYLCYLNNNFVGMRRSPDVSMVALTPLTNYHLTCYPEDFHGSTGSPLNADFVTPAAGAIDPRRVGVHALGTHWGAMGENIDLQSGNLNFSIPLLKAQGRGGWSVPLAISYNSQQWRKDVLNSTTTYWKLGGDTGTGFGWNVQFGSITPFYSDYLTVHHWTFVDAMGTSYRLDINSSGKWTSKEGLVATFDAAKRKLFFPDGSFWFFDAISASNEPDAGTYFPTLMQDTNGNQVLVRYKAGTSLSYQNSSSRIWQIEDVRTSTGSSGISSFEFCYDDIPLNQCLGNWTTPSASPPHLVQIYDYVGSGARYDFAYTNNVAISDPYINQPFGTASTLSYINNPLNVRTSMAYNASGELTQTTLPYGGTFTYNYAAKQLSGRYMREVASRVLNANDVNGNLTYTLSHDDAGDAGRFAHSYTVVADASNKADKAYFFEIYPYWGMGLLRFLYERDTTSGIVDKRITTPTWSQTPNGRPFISSTEEVIDPNGANLHARTEQLVDDNGNLQWRKQYNYAVGTATPVLARTYNYYYVTSSNYTNLNILNRMSSVTLQKPGGSLITLATNTYDGGSLSAHSSTPPEWDPSVPSFRGNVTRSVTPGSATNTSYYTTGAVAGSSDDTGHSVTMTPSTANSFAVPSAISTGSLSSSFSWNSSLALTQSTGPNSATATYSYSYGRPTQSTSPTGEVTNFTYVNYSSPTNPATQTATTGTRWVKTTLDGLGRPKLTETGWGTTTEAVVDTEYTACACTPIGKLLRTSLPHATGNGVVKYWTTNVYDALGRTLQVIQPAGSGTAVYSYTGNSVTTTDAAGKWKTFQNDVMGNLTKVTEPNPAGGTYDTNYTYSELGQLLTVSMLRGSVTQTRTFVYDATTQRLTSVTNPENGTTNHFYNADGSLAYKTDQKGQKIAYTYDSMQRVTMVQRYLTVNAANDEPLQRTEFEYDANSVVPAFSQNVSGRLAVAKSYALTVSGGVSANTTFYEMYSYDAAGRVLKKRLRISNSQLGVVDKDMEYSFTSAQLNTMKYPDINVPFTYSYDSMMRPNRMTGKDPTDYVDGTNTVDYVTNVTYSSAGRMLTMGGRAYTYNERNELIQQTGPGVDIQYEYSAANDNGQILSRRNNVTAEKVTYQYDALKRLVAASATNTVTSAAIWGSTYGYDGFGNLLSKTPTTGSAPNLSVTVDGLTNRVIGFTYDANGNMTSSGGAYSGGFDVDNRLAAANGETYAYLTSGQRIYKRDASGNEWIYLHDASGKRLVTYQMLNINSALLLQVQSKNVYFAGRPITLNDTTVQVDRIGSVVSRGGAAVDYFPYGEEKTVTANPAEKFGTYLRDATGLDYADQRYYSSATGRFLSSDPYESSAGAEDPGSWGRYSYVQSDPINFFDPNGLEATGTQPSVPAWVPADQRSAPPVSGTAPASPNIYNVFARICIGKRCVTSQVNTGSLIGRNPSSELQLAEKWYDSRLKFQGDWELDREDFKKKYGQYQSDINDKYNKEGFGAFGACFDNSANHLLTGSGGLPGFSLYDDALRMADTVIAVINQTTVGPNGEQSEWVRQLAVIVRQLLYDDAPNISGLRAQAAEITTEIFNADRKKCVSGL